MGRRGPRGGHRPDAPGARPLERNDSRDTKRRSTAPRWRTASCCSSYMKDAHSAARADDARGKPVARDCNAGARHGVWSPARLRDTEMFYSFIGYTDSARLLPARSANGQKHACPRKARWLSTPAAYETKAGLLQQQRRHARPDVSELSQRAKLDGTNPTLLYGYGGFDIAVTPQLQSRCIAKWMEMGGRLCGGESARRLRIRRGVASGRHAREEAERVRRLYRRGRDG